MLVLILKQHKTNIFRYPQRMSMRAKILFLFLSLVPLQLISSDAEETNILVYGEGSIQVDAEIDNAEDLKENMPLQGSVMVTHNANQSIDPNSFRIGDKPLKVQFVKSSSIFSSSNITVSIYSFQLPGMTTGIHTLPPIKVQVAGKEYETPPRTIQVGWLMESYDSGWLSCKTRTLMR
jgi:hypothetical protein